MNAEHRIQLLELKLQELNTRQFHIELMLAEVMHELEQNDVVEKNWFYNFFAHMQDKCKADPVAVSLYVALEEQLVYARNRE